ncbi:MAG: hypothetical protein QOG50_2683, partial [Actinomycetota bacterium]|nr:hypothetical protein [Actinomycetota bacterium]
MPDVQLESVLLLQRLLQVSEQVRRYVDHRTAFLAHEMLMRD